MAEETIFDAVAGLLRANKCLKENLDTDTLVEELEMDSVHLTYFLLELEEHFEVVVPDEIWQKWTKVGDIVDYITEYQQKYSNTAVSEDQESSVTQKQDPA